MNKQEYYNDTDIALCLSLAAKLTRTNLGTIRCCNNLRKHVPYRTRHVLDVIRKSNQPYLMAVKTVEAFLEMEETVTTEDIVMLDELEKFFLGAAEMLHEINKVYCESIGDTSQVHWEDAPEWQKTSAVNGVRFHYEHPNATPADSHVNWLEEKVNNGWVYGPVKDVDKKQHPCCMPYNDLPESQRIKDTLFKTCVTALIGIAVREGMIEAYS